MIFTCPAEAAFERIDALLLIRWAANGLTRRERDAAESILQDENMTEAAKRLGISHQAVDQYRRRAIDKMRRKLNARGIYSVRQLLSEPGSYSEAA